MMARVASSTKRSLITFCVGYQTPDRFRGGLVHGFDKGRKRITLDMTYEITLWKGWAG